MKIKFEIFLGLFFIITFSCSFFKKEVDLILKNSHIYTLDKNNTIAEAVAIKDGKIEAVGSESEILNKYKSKDVIDLNGKYVYPGFIDSHGHILGYGIALSTLDCSDAKSANEIADRIKEKVKISKPGEWIIGRGWDQNTWMKKEFPDHDILDRVAPENPVFLIRVDGHAVWVNVNTMILAGITPLTKDPDGGKILKKKSGEPTGVFLDAAISLIERVRPEMTYEQKEKCILTALHECSKYGLTEVHDMGIDTATISIYKKLIDQNKMPLRVYAFIDGVSPAWDHYKKTGKEKYGEDFLTIAGIKLYVDGALGSRGAALIQPYSDDPDNRGLTLISEKDLTDLAKQALASNLQIAVHCIGDRANSIALNAIEKALKEKPTNDHRFRIEHCQVLDSNDVVRFHRLGIIPSMQPVHATSDMHWAEARLGKNRIKFAYAWRSLLSTGSIIPGGSDFPVENPNPLLGIYAACTRKDLLGLPERWYKDRDRFSFANKDVDTTQFENGWYSFQKMNRDEAIRSFTSWGAFAAFQEKIKGTIEPEKYADFVILSDNILSVEPEKVAKTQVEMTIVGGKIVYKKD